MSSGLDPWEPLNNMPGLSGDTTGNLVLTTLLVQSIAVNDAATFGKPGDSRTGAQLQGANETLAVWLPAYFHFDVALEANLFVTGDVIIAGDLTVETDLIVNGTSDLLGDVTIGTAAANATLTVNGNEIIESNASLGAGTPTLSVINNTNAGITLQTTSAGVSGKAIEAEGQVTISNTVQGDFTVSNLDVTGDANNGVSLVNIENTLGGTGIDALTVTGNTAYRGDLSVARLGTDNGAVAYPVHVADLGGGTTIDLTIYGINPDSTFYVITNGGGNVTQVVLPPPKYVGRLIYIVNKSGNQIDGVGFDQPGGTPVTAAANIPDGDTAMYLVTDIVSPESGITPYIPVLTLV
jgi:hypothetical protein